MAVFASRVLWNGFVRFALFWGVLVGVVIGVERHWPPLDFQLIWKTLAEALAGETAGVSSQAFAFALASGLGAVALGLAAAFGVLHALLIPLALRSARRRIERTRDPAGFAASYETINKVLSRHPLVGHAWHEFAETLVPPRDEGGIYRNTLRPQAFVGMGSLRERLVGLKLMGGIPGYFVGIGLLLTFTGLVLALSKAASAVNSAGPEGMQIATRELLQVATFKFATSIAGLGASIVLSFVFKLYSIRIESALDGFCRAAEAKLSYIAPQQVTLEMSETLAGQLTELKQINSADFFARMGESLQPGIQSAFATAMAPVTQSIDQAMGRLQDTSQSGVSDLIERFTQGVQGGAGAELQALAATLQSMQGALLDAQRGISGSGEDFGRRMTEAAENLSRLVSDAGQRLDDSAEMNRAALVNVLESLRSTLDQASGKIDEGLTQAATAASERLADAMGKVMGRLEGQIGTFGAGLTGFQEGMAGQLEESRRQVALAQASAAEAIGGASAEAAKALRDGLAEALREIVGEVERFTGAMRATETSLTAQGVALKDATVQSRAVADAFGRTAQDVRTAAVPLVQSGERIAGATDKMSEALARSVEALEAGQASARALAEAITRHNGELAGAWASYSERFATVDRSLAEAVGTLAKAAEDQGQVLSERVRQIDRGFAEAIDRLNPFLGQLSDNTESLQEEVGKLVGKVRLVAAE